MNIHLSHWETDSWIGKCDFLVIGAGIVGLSAALRLRELHPQAEIRVLERGLLPSGASTKNAGFACFGSLSELQDDLRHSSRDEILALVERRWRGLRRLRERIGDRTLRYEAVSGYELFEASGQARYLDCLENMEHWNRELAAIVGTDRVYRQASAKVAEFGFEQVRTMIENSREGLIDTGRMMRELLRLVQGAGILVLTNAEVTTLEPIAGHVRILTANGWEFRAGQTIVAVNGFARRLLPTLPVDPARAQVLITEPIPGLRLRGGFHLDRGYYYFRHLGDRILLGGGRNLDFKAEETDAIALTEIVQKELERLLREVILPGRQAPIAHRWAGIMGVGSTKQTIIQKIHPRVTCAVRLGGMGVAIGTLVGEDAAELAGAV